MITFKRWQGLAAGFALIGAINAFALGGAWYNRQGEPESVLLLSERELSRAGGLGETENSGLALRLQWEMPQDDNAQQVFSAAQMQRAGFAAEAREDCSRRPEHPVLVALELDGPAYQHALARARQTLESARQDLAKVPDDPRRVNAVENAQRQLNWTQNRSRLYAVDIDQDAAALRQRWPDRSRYAIVHGRVRPLQGCGALSGALTGIAAEYIQAPRPFHAALAELPNSYWRNDEPVASRYRIEIAFGQRLEPWLRRAEQLAPAP